MVIAPASATTIARLAHGLGDEMLACQALAFDGPILLAPAMNPKMWGNAATNANIETLLNRGFFLRNRKAALSPAKTRDKAGSPGLKRFIMTPWLF